MTDSLAGDLKEHIFRAYFDLAPQDRWRSRWVMNLEWRNECRRIEAGGATIYQPGLKVSGPEYLLGMPVEIRDGGGVPHLEMDYDPS